MLPFYLRLIVEGAAAVRRGSNHCAGNQHLVANLHCHTRHSKVLWPPKVWITSELHLADC